MSDRSIPALVADWPLTTVWLVSFVALAAGCLLFGSGPDDLPLVIGAVWKLAVIPSYLAGLWVTLLGAAEKYGGTRDTKD